MFLYVNNFTFIMENSPNSQVCNYEYLIVPMTLNEYFNVSCPIFHIFFLKKRQYSFSNHCGGLMF